MEEMQIFTEEEMLASFNTRFEGLCGDKPL
jgi:hypothetical protein